MAQDWRNGRVPDVERHSADTRTIRIVPQLKELIEISIPLFDEHNTNTHKRNVVAWHRYGAKVNLDGKEGYVRLMVRGKR